MSSRVINAIRTFIGDPFNGQSEPPTSVGGSPDYASVLPKVERNERGVWLTKWVKNTQQPAHSAKYATYGPDALVDRWMYYDFLVPGILLMDGGMMPAGTGGQDQHRDNAIAFRGCQALTPETDSSTHYFFAHAHNFLIDRPEMTREIHAELIGAFEEDRAMITAQQQNLALDPTFKMMPLSVDAAPSQFRWLIDRLLQKEQRSGSDDERAA